MKRFISLILCVVLILNFSFMSGMVSFGILANAEETNSSIPQPVDLKSREDFSVGINIHLHDPRTPD